MAKLGKSPETVAVDLTPAAAVTDASAADVEAQTFRGGKKHRCLK